MTLEDPARDQAEWERGGRNSGSASFAVTRSVTDVRTILVESEGANRALAGSNEGVTHDWQYAQCEQLAEAVEICLVEETELLSDSTLTLALLSSPGC